MAINRYYNTKYASRNSFLALGIKCVFISHQQKDKEAAKEIADYLIAAGIDVYFDEYDKDLKIHHQSNNPRAVTDAIRTGINNSSHMLVVVSPNTLYSTWVPFEIGYGYDKTDLYALCLKGIPKKGVPEYVRSAAIIRDIDDLNNLISRISKVDKEILIQKRMMSDYGNQANPLRDVMDAVINDSYK